MKISFGDNVRVLPSPETEALELAGQEGQVYGESTPSVTGLEVIGDLKSDFAINVFFESRNTGYWFAPELLEFVDHAEGMEITTANIRAVRRADGSWDESEIRPRKKWWELW